MTYKVQYVRADESEVVERSFEEFVTARSFYNQRKKGSQIIILTETKVIDIAFPKEDL